MRLWAVLLSGLLLWCAAAQAQVRNYDAIIAVYELKVAVYKDFAPTVFRTTASRVVSMWSWRRPWPRPWGYACN